MVQSAGVIASNKVASIASIAFPSPESSKNKTHRSLKTKKEISLAGFLKKIPCRSMRSHGHLPCNSCDLAYIMARLLLVALALHGANALHLPGPPPRRMSRRSVLLGALLTPAPALASDSPSVFVGTYTDPNNHPGGTREITLLPGQVGAYRLANVKGGGGRGEPDLYNLPALIIERPESQQIVIDFSVSPKNGPRDFAGQYVAGPPAGIRFVRDGNLWPKQP